MGKQVKKFRKTFQKTRRMGCIINIIGYDGYANALIARLAEGAIQSPKNCNVQAPSSVPFLSTAIL